MKRFSAALALFFASIAVSVASATTYLVNPDGSGDFPTIGAAISGAAAGDTISLGDGTFTGAGNYNFDFNGKQLVVRSVSGVPEDCVIDCQAVSHGFIFQSGEDSASKLEGFTIVNANAGYGSAIFCLDGSSPTIENCILWGAYAMDGGALACLNNSNPTLIGCLFRENLGEYGGAVHLDTGSSPSFEDCDFVGNRAFLGAGMYCDQGNDPTISDCGFYENVADGGVALYLRGNSDAVISNTTFAKNIGEGVAEIVYLLNSSSVELTSCTLAFNEAPRNSVIDAGNGNGVTMTNTIVAHNAGGSALHCFDPTDVTLSCCDLFGNEDGDWVDCISGQEGIDGNFSSPPLFCDAANDDYSIAENSLCAPENNIPCGLVGAWPVGCPPACSIELTPASVVTYTPCGGSFPVDLWVDHVVDLGSFDVCSGFDGDNLEFDSVVIDPAFLGSTGRIITPTPPSACASTCQSHGMSIGATTSGAQPGPSGAGRLATIFWEPSAEVSATDDFLCLDGWSFENTAAETIPVAFDQGMDLAHRTFCYGDFNDNGDVSVVDVMEVGNRWGLESGESGYNVLYDVNLLVPDNYCASVPDGAINIVDVQSVAARWGQGCPGDVPRADPADAAQAIAARDASPARLRIAPETMEITGEIGETGVFTLDVDDAQTLGSFEASLHFDPDVIRVEDVEMADFLESTGRAVYPLDPRIDNENGVFTVGAWSLGENAGPDGNGSLVRVTVSIQSCPATTGLEIHEAVITDTRGWPHLIGEMASGSIVTECPTPTDAPESILPDVYSLLPSRPNPFSHSTTLPFAIPSTAGDGVSVEMLIVDASGRTVRRFDEGAMAPGLHEIVWDGRDNGGVEVSSGTYFCCLRAGGAEFTRQIVLVQ